MTKNIVKRVLGRQVIYPALIAGTLGRDDVRLARQWLSRRTLWHDTSIVSAFEKSFAEWNGSKHAFAFMGGRIALSACIQAIGLKPGDDVILPGYTCVVVPNALLYAGVRPVYSDIELDSYGLDASVLENAITDRTKAILLHHLYGLVCRDYERILEIARKHKLRVIEDCAHATGALWMGKRVGNYGDVAFYSAEQSKVFTTIQGGVAVTNDEVIASGIKKYYDAAPIPDDKWIEKQLFNVILNYHLYKHPQRWWIGPVYAHIYRNRQMISTTVEEEIGICPDRYGRRMPAPIAAIGRNQLRKIDQYNSLRRRNAARYGKWCERNGYTKPMVVDGSVPVFLRYPVLVEPEKKSDTAWVYKELKVTPGIWFESNIHPTIHRTVHGCPNANIAVSRCINFPGGP